MNAFEEFDLKATKSRLEIRNLVMKDELVAGYFAALKKDEMGLKREFSLALKLGVMALTDDRLITVLKQLEEHVDGSLASLRQKLLLESVRSGQQEGRILERKLLLSEIDRLARVFDDRVEATGDQAGLDVHSKKGDFVVTLSPRDTGGADVRIVVESKSERLTIPDLLTELEQGKQNRIASEAIIVFDAKKAPDQVGAFRQFPGRGIACSVRPETLDMMPLEVAYKIARADALVDYRQQQSDHMPQVDFGRFAA